MLKLTLEYDGGPYVGWQVQPNGPSIQGTLQAAIEELCGAHPGSVQLIGAGRTDAGVHARGQVASLAPPRELPLKAWTAGLNGLLPPSISCVRVEPAPEGFDARRWARGKRYVYSVLRRQVRSPLNQGRAWLIRRPLDLAAMREAAQALIGRHDFSALRAANCAAATAVREIRRLEMAAFPDGPGERVEVTVEATAFLKHMVRNLVGTLVQVGHGLRRADSIGALLEGRDRREAGPTAPPHGLCLDEVFYLPGLANPRAEASPMAPGPGLAGQHEEPESPDDE